MAADVEAQLRVQAAVLLPRGGGVDVAGGVPAAPAVRAVRSFSQAAVATSGPAVHLLRAVGPELRPSHVDAEQLHVHVLMWMVDSRDRCVGGVSSWPARRTARPCGTRRGG